MNFNQKLAQYVLGNFTAKDLPDVAMTGLIEKYESESLVILAGFCKNENSLEILYYFKKALIELDINLKNEKEAAIELINFYANEILEERVNVWNGMRLIINNVLNRTNLWDENNIAAYDSIGFENLYALYWQIEEIENNEIIIDITRRDELILKIEQDIKVELKNWIQNTEGIKLSRHRNI